MILSSALGEAHRLCALYGGGVLFRTAEKLPAQVAHRLQEQAGRRGEKLDKSVEGIISGRMFYAEDALKYGLIDSIGDKQYAINRAREIARDNAVSAYLQTKNIK